MASPLRTRGADLLVYETSVLDPPRAIYAGLTRFASDCLRVDLAK
ncbi:MAG TPA: hypothetical protein VH044_18650 [Polyangiaceae bacterium]|nr:hypothetical protein [Polyangiaceae bacterium]